MNKSEETWRKVQKKLRKVKKRKENEEKWRNMTTKQRFLSTCHLRRLIHTHTQMAHGKKFWFCSHFFPLFSFFFIFLQNPTRRNMKKSEENEEKWRKLEKSGYKTKKLFTCHLRRLVHTHTQMAHGKKSWFCSNFSSLFFVFIHFSRQCWKVEKSGEKWRQHEENKKETCMGSEGFEALRSLTRKYSKTHA